jgi:Xaa-Pro aminopeptidase
MRAAARLTVEGFADTSAMVRNAEGEWQVQAALEHAFRRRGASGTAFPSIIAAGANAAVLHYTRNSARLDPTDLLLVDAGATVDHYHADVTRTWSISGRPSAAQREAHEIVLRAHRAALAAVRPGATEASVHRAALAELLRGMEALRLIEEKADAALAAEEERLRARPSESEPVNGAAPARPAWTRFFPHRVSHWLGLEVHDVGDYAADGESRLLEPGMVLTIEPGLYIPPDDDAAPAALRGIGVRIEDDVLVVPDGADVLSRGLPTGVSLP